MQLYLHRLTCLALTFSCIVLLMGCGQTGPLYLPKQQTQIPANQSNKPCHQ